MRRKKKSGVQLHFVILNNGAEKGHKPLISVDIEDVDITTELALEIAEELNACKTINAWITSPGEQ